MMSEKIGARDEGVIQTCVSQSFEAGGILPGSHPWGIRAEHKTPSASFLWRSLVLYSTFIG